MEERHPQPVVEQDLDEELATTMEQSARALERLGVTVDDLLGEIAAVHAEDLDARYGADFMRDIERRIAERQQAAEQASQPRV